MGAFGYWADPVDGPNTDECPVGCDQHALCEAALDRRPTIECAPVSNEEAIAELTARTIRWAQGDYGSDPIIKPDRQVTPPLEVVEREQEQAVPQYVDPDKEPTKRLTVGVRR